MQTRNHHFFFLFPSSSLTISCDYYFFFFNQHLHICLLVSLPPGGFRMNSEALKVTVQLFRESFEPYDSRRQTYFFNFFSVYSALSWSRIELHKKFSLSLCADLNFEDLNLNLVAVNRLFFILLLSPHSVR